MNMNDVKQQETTDGLADLQPHTAADDTDARKMTATVDLDTPIKRGDAPPVHQLTLRRPDAGALRGVSLLDLVQMETNALRKVLPRICSPVITDADVRQLDAADIFALGVEVASFLAPKKLMEGYQEQ